MSPDLDIVTYTLAGRVDPEKGYGLAGDSFATVEALGALGHATWFRLGDRDLATVLHRTLRLREGAGLAAVTDEVRRAYRVPVRDPADVRGPCPTYVILHGGRRVHFEEYLARDGAPDEVEGVDLDAARAAEAGPGVLDAIRAADADPRLPQQPGRLDRPDPRGARCARDDRGVARAGRRDLADHRRRAREGTRRSSVARHRRRGLRPRRRRASTATGCDGYVMDQRDADQQRDVEALGLTVCVTDTVMRDRGSRRPPRIRRAPARELPDSGSARSRPRPGGIMIVTAAIVPVKHLAAGKSRLAQALGREGAERLALAMLEDVVAALRAAQRARRDRRRDARSRRRGGGRARRRARAARRRSGPQRVDRPRRPRAGRRHARRHPGGARRRGGRARRRSRPDARGARRARTRRASFWRRRATAAPRRSRAIHTAPFASRFGADSAARAPRRRARRGGRARRARRCPRSRSTSTTKTPCAPSSPRAGGGAAHARRAARDRSGAHPR